MDTRSKGQMKCTVAECPDLRWTQKPNVGLRSNGPLVVQMHGASGGLTLREQHLLEENTQWKLSFLLYISVVELGQTKGQRERESARKSLTRSTKQLKAAQLLCILAKIGTLLNTGKTQYFNMR